MSSELGGSHNSATRKRRPSSEATAAVKVACQDESLLCGLELEDVTIPWDHYVDESANCKAFGFATKPYFWRRVQWALTFTLFACLPAAVLAFHPDTVGLFEVPTMFLPFCVVCTKAFVGESFDNLIGVLKGFLIVLVTLSVFTAMDVATHWLAWGSVFAVVVFVIAFLTVGGTAINALLLFTIGMIVHFDDSAPHLGWKYGSYLVRDSLVGCGLAVFAVVFPAPRTNYGVAKQSLADAYRDFGLIIIGLSDALNAPAGTRQGKMILIRFKRDAVKDSLVAAATHLKFAWYEPFVGEMVNKMEARYRLLSGMMVSADALIDSLAEFGENQNWVNYRTKRFEETKMHMSLKEGTGSDEDGGVLRTFEEEFENGFELLSSVMAQDLRAIWKTTDDTDSKDVGEANHPSDPTTTAREQKLASGSKNLSDFLDHTNSRFLVGLNTAIFKILDLRAENAETHKIDSRHRFPRIVLGYYLFNLSQIARLMIAYKEPPVWTTGARIKVCLTSPIRAFQGTGKDLKAFFVDREENMVEKAIDALKISVAMTAMAAWVLAVDSPEKVFSGPAVIAFVSGGDVGQTMRGSAEQLFGTILGSVAGFILASLGTDPVEMGGWVCLVALITGFVRGSKTYGFVAFYMQFAAFGAISPFLDYTTSLKMIQQNVAAIMVYFVLIFFVWPHMPSERLKKETRHGFLSMKASFALMKISFLFAQQENKVIEAKLRGEENGEAQQKAGTEGGREGFDSLVVTENRTHGGDDEEMIAQSEVDLQSPTLSVTVSMSRSELQEQQKRLTAIADLLPLRIANQSKALFGASLEPALSDRDFPTHHVERVIEAQTSIHAILTALKGAEQTFLASSAAVATANTNVVLIQLTPILIEVTTAGIQLLDRMTATLDGTLAPNDSLLSKTCMLLDRHHARLEVEEVAATNQLVAALRDSGRVMSGDVSVPPAVLTQIQCTFSLVVALKTCYHTFLTAQQAIRRQVNN